MIYCIGASKATITVSINNQIVEKVISNLPAVNVNLQHGQTAQIQGAGVDLNNCGQLNNYAIREYNGFLTFVAISVVTPASNPAGFCSGLKPAVNGETTSGTDDVYHSSAKIIRQYSSDWVLTVIDSAGRIITREYLIEPTYTVACDDECPEGFCKCLTPEYPGYCCLNCASTAASIRTITNELRGKNG